MAEVMAEGTYVPHHPQKIALILSAMRHFAAELARGRLAGRLFPAGRSENTQSIPGELIRRAAETGARAR
jgi:deoxyribodipyrimidine photolyase-related protein